MHLTIQSLFLEPINDLVSLEDFKFVWTAFGILVLVQKFDHKGVVVKLDQTEHLIGSQLWHVNLADVG